MKSCYISIPKKSWVIELADELRSRDIKAVFATDVNEFEGSYASTVASVIKSCDITLCIADDERSLKSVLFEAGIAFGIGKKVLLATSYDAGNIPIDYSEFPIIRLDSSHYQEIASYVEEVLRYGKKPTSKKKYNFIPSKPIGAYSQKYVESLREIEEKILGACDKGKVSREFEKLIAEAIRKSGVNIVSEFRSGKYRPDIAIWSDELTYIGANPLIVEVKSRIKSLSELERVVDKLNHYLLDSNSKYGLLIYLSGPERDQYFYDLPSNIIAVSAFELLRSLEGNSFGEVIRDLRNQRVHGMRG
ncbi:hypothetical protein [Haliea salexigens]|uniref:hypothetical protein n=1 Tax=Haliea salexigens TaxID=287487 RepID=UPI0004896378|nr:hypothetical protein [Haliea salexigens]